MGKSIGSKRRVHSKKAKPEIVEAVGSLAGVYFKVLGDQPVPVTSEALDTGALTLGETAKKTGWDIEALIALHRMFFPMSLDEPLDPAQAWIDALNNEQLARRWAFALSHLGKLDPSAYLDAALECLEEEPLGDRLGRIADHTVHSLGASGDYFRSLHPELSEER